MFKDVSDGNIFTNNPAVKNTCFDNKWDWDTKYTGKRYIIGIVFDPKTRNVSQYQWENI